jgi:DNA-binding XRE family transcriptional regulator
MNGNDMRASRKSIAMTQHELAERLGVCRKTVIGWEATEGDLDEGVALQVQREVGAIRLIEHTFWVEAMQGTYVVIGRRLQGFGMRINGATMCYGQFARRDHAYRWCAALQVGNVDPRGTRKLQRERQEDQKPLAVA